MTLHHDDVTTVIVDPRVQGALAGLFNPPAPGREIASAQFEYDGYAQPQGFDTPPTYQDPSPEPPYPAFEGQSVQQVGVQISGLSTMDEEMPVIGLEDRVRFVGEFRCIKVNHVIDPKTGKLTRVQVVSPISITTCPWNPGDPHDDGVLRAR